MTGPIIEGRYFDGPFPLPTAIHDLKGKGGAYLIARLSSGANKYLDFDHSADVGASLGDHQRRSCWLELGHEATLAVYLCESFTEGQRLQDEGLIRDKGPFPCRS